MRIDPDKLFLRCAELEITERQALAKAGVALDGRRLIKKSSRIQAPTLAKLAKALDVRPQDLMMME